MADATSTAFFASPSSRGYRATTFARDEDAEEGEAERKKRADKPRFWTSERYAEVLEELGALGQAMVWEYRNRHGPRPMLAEETKEEMYRLHTSDPARWNLEALSLRFGLLKARVQAILTLMGMRAEAVRNGEVLRGEVVQMLEAEFGVVGRLADKRILSPVQGRGRPGAGMPLEEDANEDRLVDHALALKLARTSTFPLGELPARPPKTTTTTTTTASGAGSSSVDLVVEPRSRILRQPTPTRPHAPRGMIFIENDPRQPPWGRRQRLDDATRLIYITEPDGTLRTPTWEERRRLTSGNKRRLPLPRRYDAAEKRFFKDDD